MLKPIEQKVLNFINHYNLLPAGKKVLLAVSGGADSVALLEILLNLKLAGKITNDFHIAHINHRLRGRKSIEDEEFVRTLAKQCNLPVTIERIDVQKYAKENKLSIETAARDLRLEKLAKTAKKTGCSCVAAAHQKNDNAETVLHRLLRGTAFKGLAGIRPKTDFDGSVFIRPLLCVSRNEIENYLSSQNIHWQTDLTNFDCRFTRNRMRHRLLPYIQKHSADNIIESLFILSQYCLALSEKIENAAEKALNDARTENIVSMDIDKFNSYPSFVKVEIIQNALRRCGIGLQKITNEHYDRICKFLSKAHKEKILQLPDKAVVKISNLKFEISNLKSQPCVQNLEPVNLRIPGKVHFADWTIVTEILSADSIDIENIRNNKNNFIQWFDFDLIKPPLTVRCRQKGDRFRPFGHVSSKKVSKFLKSVNLGSEQKKKTFIICDNEKILWLVPVRRSKEAKIDISTRKILKIKAIRVFVTVHRKFMAFLCHCDPAPYGAGEAISNF